jgi:N-acetylmuramoyl-L-alanine amidase
MTRTGDYFVGLPGRCALANAQSNAVFVSIHTNSDPRGTGIGIETYYYTRKSARLAAAIHKQVVRTAGTPDRRVRTRPLYVLRKNSLPAVLVEVGFLTNAIEGPRIANSSSYRDQLAAAIVRGIRSAF